MKKYSKPVLRTEVVDDVNEPIYMACSGSEYFEWLGTGYEHQTYQIGRYDARFQIDARYTGPAYSGDLYMICIYDKPVNAATSDGSDPFGWEFKGNVIYDGSNTIIAKASGISLNASPEAIGFGDAIVQLENPLPILDPNDQASVAVNGATLKKVILAFNPNGCV